MPAHVNLWELTTTVSLRDLPNQDKCKAIQDECRKHGFCSELDLTVDNGTWTVSFFCHDGSSDRIELVIAPSGWLRISRTLERDGIRETRSISF